jgi:hypothetical protein
MKYIKTYNSVENNLPKLKKYAVFAVGRKLQLVVAEILQITKLETTFLRIYVYHNEYESLRKSDNQIIKLTNDYINRITLFTSNDLIKILEILPTLNTADKYNL